MKPAQLRKIAYGLFLIRPFFGLLIFVAPVFTSLGVFILDSVDGLFAANGKIGRKNYDKIDKSLDSIWLVTILVYVLTAPIMEPFRIPMLFLFALRMVGEVAFILTNNRKFFAIFPNYFEWVFWAYVLGAVFPGWQWLFWSIPMFVFILVLKLFFEMYMHWFKREVTPGIMTW